MKTLGILLLFLSGCLIPERSGLVEIGYVRDEALPVALRLLQMEDIPAKQGEKVHGTTVVLVPEADELRAQLILIDWRRSDPRPSFWTRDEGAPR